MTLIKKLVDWFEDLLWRQAFKDVFGNPDYYLEFEEKDSDAKCHDTK